MAKKKQVVIQESVLTNNCPECFNQDLKLTFFQKHRISRFYKQITREISQEIKCNTCGSVIYPVKWTEDIERSFEYFQKMVKPESSAVRFTKLTWGLFFLLILLIVTGAVLYYTESLKAWL